MSERRLAVEEADRTNVTGSPRRHLRLFKNIERPKKPFKPVHVYCFETSVGKMLSAADDSFVYVLTFEIKGSSIFEKRFPHICAELDFSKVLETSNKLLRQLEEELNAYFDGKLHKFTVPIKTVGTQFQRDVWTKLNEIPYGATHTYGDLAKMMGVSASHSRAIGNACGKNALLILVPCHRLVAAGSRGGYNSGVDRKQWLIDHEKEHAI